MSFTLGRSPRDLHVPTLHARLREYQRLPQAIGQLNALVAAFMPILGAFHELLSQIGAVMVQWANEKPASRGYERWLIEQGFDPILARMMAALQVHVGRRVAMDNRRLPEVVRAVKFLARPHRNRKAISRRVKILLAAWNETSVIETVFSNAGLDEFPFIRVLEGAAEGQETAYQGVVGIAAALVPHLPNPRGRRVGAASAAHESFLENVVRVRKPSRYTWNDLSGKFTDPVTEATSREFGDRSFDPRPAFRRIDSRLGRT